MAKRRDQRKYHRYPVSMPVRISPKDPDRAPGIAQAQDVSAHGIYFKVSDNFEMGASLELDMEMPSAIMDGAHIRVHCHAKIVRVENLFGSSNGIGVAAQISKFRITRPDAD